MNRLKHFIPLTICIIFACSFLFVSIESKAYYINCNLVGSRSGTDVMESDILMGRDVIDAKNLIKTSKNTYRGGDIIKVKISNLQRLGSAINFSGGEVQVSEPPMLITLPPCSTHPCPDPPRYNEGNCGIDTTHYWTMDHNKGVPTKFILKLRIPKINPPKRISIAVLTSNENLVVSRQLKTLTLSNTGQNVFDSLWDETDEMEDDGYLYARSQSLRRARLSAVPTVIYRHEHAQLTQVWNGKRKKQAGIKSWYSSGYQINAIDLEYSQDIFGRPPVRAAKAAVCAPATITETTEFVLNKCIVANCAEGARCAMFAQMYTLGYGGDPNVLKTTEYWYGASEDPLPLNPCSTAAQRTPWYTSRPLGTLGVQGCTVDELHISNAAAGRFNYCQWNTDRPDLSSACILKAAQSPQGFSKCRGANPDEREAKTQCRTGRRSKPCGCFTAVSWSTSATQARL